MALSVAQDSARKLRGRTHSSEAELPFLANMVTKEMAKNMPTVHQCEEMLALKEYVTARDSTRYDGLALGNLRLDVSHSNLIQRWHDILFAEEMTVMEVKEKLYRHGGTPVAWQELYLRRGGGDTIFLLDDSKTLRHYGAKSGMEIYIKDLDPHSLSKHGGLEDVSQVEKYVMPDEEYDKLKNSVRAQKRAACEAAERARAEGGGAAQEEEAQAPSPLEMTLEEAAAAFPLGGRCECDPGARRGEISYVGPLAGVKSIWVGVRLDEPQGQNDGTKDGKSYFECRPKYGCFAKPANVRVGDYPERDPFASDDEF
uniref:CAP-Gly domain-containing protein n=1 Tax=Alexandrium monilatum TaxID=311494 RepID=A0A7S4PUS1_9DINO